MDPVKVGRPGMLDALAGVIHKAAELQEWIINPRLAGSSPEQVDAVFAEAFQYLEGSARDARRFHRVWLAECAKEPDAP